MKLDVTVSLLTYPHTALITWSKAWIGLLPGTTAYLRILKRNQPPAIGIRDRRVHECRLTFCLAICSPIAFVEYIDVSYVCNGYSYCVVNVADNWTRWHAWRQKVRRWVNSWGKHAKTKRWNWGFTFPGKMDNQVKSSFWHMVPFLYSDWNEYSSSKYQ